TATRKMAAMILFFMIRLPMSLSISAGPDPAYQIPLYLRNPAGSAEEKKRDRGCFTPPWVGHNAVHSCGELGRRFFQTLNNRWASRNIPIGRHVGSASVHNTLFHQAKDEVDAAFIHRIYRMAACSSRKEFRARY